MRKNKYAIISFVIAITLFITGIELFAADKKTPKAPTRNEVVIVFSLKIQPLPDVEFFANYSHMRFSKLDIGHYYSTTDKIAISASNVRIPLAGMPEEDARDIDFAMITLPFAYGKRYINLHSLRYHFAGSEVIFVNLPLQVKIEVPDDVRYVYIGDFTCKCSKPFYDITDVKRTDNFDAAAKAVKAVYGKDAELERVPLISLDKED